ncbi:MAG: hypothetical protein SPE75_06415 [Prevotella sp.]|nr:hypothetical protein [Prevotella sp.]
MLILVAILILLGVVTGVMALVMHRKDRPEPPVVEQATCATCNGDNDKCEQECMMEAATQPIEYFEDEELDAFRGRPSDSYDDDETQQFADVLYTMRQDEVAAWCRSLTLRGINLPNALKDEVVMMIE